MVNRTVIDTWIQPLSYLLNFLMLGVYMPLTQVYLYHHPDVLSPLPEFLISLQYTIYPVQVLPLNSMLGS